VEVLQKLAPKNLDEAVVAAIRSTLMYLLSENRLIHPRLFGDKKRFFNKKGFGGKGDVIFSSLFDSFKIQINRL
jgi:hypothetical protein